MLERFMVSDTKSVKEVIEYMEENDIKTVFVVDESKRMQGLFTYGDMRKFFLKDGNMANCITSAMNKSPIVYSSYEEAEKERKKNKMIVYPVIDSERHIIDALFERDIEENEISIEFQNDFPLVIMAGGKGTRLYPYTKILPKALIPIGEETISERIINRFVRYGCKDIYFILNHKGNMIKSYFNDIVEKKYNTHYIDEPVFLGTGGGLALLKGKIDKTFILSNCDILINADIDCLLKTHKLQKNKITFVCAMKDMVIPYGVINTNEDGKIESMVEKPELSFLTNTGVYVIEPEVIEELEDNEFIHLPDIAKKYLDKGENIGVFPISGKAWFDMGQFSEMENMIKELGV